MTENEMSFHKEVYWMSAPDPLATGQSTPISLAEAHLPSLKPCGLAEAGITLAQRLALTVSWPIRTPFPVTGSDSPQSLPGRLNSWSLPEVLGKRHLSVHSTGSWGGFS